MRATESAVETAYATLKDSAGDSRTMAAARLLLAIFDDFYGRFCEYSQQAKRAFERGDAHHSVRISRERLGLYSRYIVEHGKRVRECFPALSEDAHAWDLLDRMFGAMIVDRYEADIAFSFAHSIRRNLVRELWKPVAYSFPPPSPLRALSMAAVHRRLLVDGRIDAHLIEQMLKTPGFDVPFRDIGSDAVLIRRRAEQILEIAYGGRAPAALDVIQAGFFRDRSAFIVGRWVLPGESFVPFVIALLNGEEGIFADAVLHRVSDIHTLFSSTLANLHVTTPLYYQCCVFLFSLMPRRPMSEHYSTIGYNHLGKVAILNEITSQMKDGTRFSASPGAAGTVALGFTFENCPYHLKVIRDRPTKSYKWGNFPGVVAVEEKYREVHEINRAGSMLDNVMYFNLRLDKSMFEDELLEELQAQAGGTVQVHGDGVFLRALIVQLKIVPLPVFLAKASETEVRAAMIGLGACIRNNAATNIFNRDLDSRNYGVGRYGRVFLFDYDAVERFTDVKIRTNSDREPGEDDVPEWFFEEGVVFLPEELPYGMQFGNDLALKYFQRENAELLSVEYWSRVQNTLKRGDVAPVSMYPEALRLKEELDA